MQDDFLQRGLPGTERWRRQSEEVNGVCACASEEGTSNEPRYADKRDPDRACVQRDWWTGAFDVRITVPTTERLGGLAHLDPLLGHLQGHVLGRMPEDALVTELITRYPTRRPGRRGSRAQTG